MTENTKTDITKTQSDSEATVSDNAGQAFEYQGAAGFADAESREILNLLGDAEAGGTCCGGSCCSA